MTPRTALFFAVTLIACPAAHCEQPYDVLFDYHGNTATVSGPNPASEHYTFGRISIPNTVEYNGNTYTVTDIYPSAFQGWTDLVHIDIPSTVTTIPDSAFFGCINFRTIYC
ncbi:MAG: leucine-rich repeat domain-containing protein, partial [Tannerellaceae bacterium]|nr:leucine-rich repeat domain-containing protein [Tannerellaceae bacterium]